MVIFLRAVILICALLVITYLAPAVGQDAQVIMEQAGSMRSPFDVGGSITYRVPVVNSIGSSMRYAVALSVGPDTNDYSIVDAYTKDMNVNAHSTGYIEFVVNFKSPKISRGEFGRWASDENDTRIWDKAWYHVDIKPLLGDSTVIESYDGQPNLFKAFFDYKNPEVTPAQGTNGDLYSYEITALGTYEDNISLQVAPSREGPWIDLGSRAYSIPGSSQTLRWDDNRLNFDFIVAYYKFVGRKQSKVLEGPFWPISVEAKNSSVIPPRDLTGSKFTYRLEINASKNIDVGLNALDVGSGVFNLVGRASYKNPGQWQEMVWSDIEPSGVSGSDGRSSYFFTYYYVGSEMPFQKTEQYPGPDIVLVNFKNATVIPNNGTLFMPYTYNISIDTAVPRGEAELLTSNPYSSIWDSQGKVNYDSFNHSLTWPDIKLDGSRGGMARYKFICGASESQVYQGPQIKVPEVLGSVSPSRGVVQAWQESDSLYSFNYTVQLRNWSSEEAPWIELLVRAPDRPWRAVGEKKQYDQRRGNLTWIVKPFYDAPFLGIAQFKFVIDGVDSPVFDGPQIVAVYGGMNYEKSTAKDKYNYFGTLKASADLSVNLLKSVDTVHWEKVGASQNYVNGTGDVRLIWKNQPAMRYYELGITVSDGKGVGK